MGNIIGWLILGALAGWAASVIMGTYRRQGLLRDILVGAAGAIVGGFLARLLGIGDVTGLNLPSFLVALAGSVLLLWLFGRRR